MENKHGPGASAGSLGGKGFYIVLFLCAAVIGVSAWMLLTDAGTNVDNETLENTADVSGAYVTMLPAMDQSQDVQDVPAMAETELPNGETDAPADAAQQRPAGARDPGGVRRRDGQLCLACAGHDPDALFHPDAAL